MIEYKPSIFSKIITLILVLIFIFIAITLLLSAIIGCIWLWKHFITGGFYV